MSWRQNKKGSVTREIATRCARETTSSLATQQRRPGEIGLSTSLGEHVSVTRVPSQLRAGCTWKRSCTCRIGGSRGSAKLASTCYQSYIKLDHPPRRDSQLLTSDCSRPP